MKRKSPQKSTFKDSDFAGVDPAKRQALVTALNSLSDQLHSADKALQDMESAEPDPAPPADPESSEPASDPP